MRLGITLQMNVDDNFDEIRECVYKEERYLVRNNGAVFRYSREDKPKRKNDNHWSFGTPNKQNGYMYLGQARVHRIVALAFLGESPTNEHIVDHIDTNRKNNRPENLRYLTKLENALINPITRSKIIYYCGSIEAFLENPKMLREKANKIDKNLEWMRQVTPSEAQNCLKNLQYLSLRDEKRDTVSQGMGEWIYQPINFDKQKNISINECDTEAIFPEIARQRNWKTPTEFLCCPQEFNENPIDAYDKNLKKDSAFSRNRFGTSLIIDFAISKDKESLLIITKNEESIKPYALTRVTYENNFFIHTSLGSFFREDGAYKYWTIEQGLEWNGGEVFDDYC